MGGWFVPRKLWPSKTRSTFCETVWALKQMVIDGKTASDYKLTARLKNEMIWIES